MTASSHVYANALDKALNGLINASSDSFNCALMAASYTPDYLDDAVWSDISAHEAAGTGYTAGGQNIDVVTQLTQAVSWGVNWTATTVFPYQQIVVPSSPGSLVYLAVVGGTTGSGEPTWPVTFGDTVTDGGVTWLSAGTAVEVLTGGEPEWNPITVDTAFAVIYDSTSGALISCQDFGGTLDLTAADFVVDPNGYQGWYFQILI